MTNEIKTNQILAEPTMGNFYTLYVEDNKRYCNYLNMEIDRPSSVSLSSITYSTDSRCKIDFGINFDDDIETLEKLVEWTENVTRKVNKRIKELKDDA